MKKTGIINQVYKGLKVWLFETGTRVQQTDFTNVSEGQQMVKELQDLLKSLERKAFLEDQYFLPALALTAPYVVSIVEEEKRQVKDLSSRLNKKLEQYLLPGTTGHYSSTGHFIQQAFIEFLSYILMYMNRQESLFDGLSTQDNQTGMVSLTDLAEDHAMELAVWMLKGMNNRDISEWLESGNTGSLAWKRRILGSLSPERLHAAGHDFENRGKKSMAAA
jgi:hypothetical protein